ncbi:MAG: hypothetical protein FWC97_10915, partial [Treponema sp.]|nr:hypothetical protein [Treponema sp.]
YFRRFNIQFMGADFWDTVFEDGLTPREFLDEWALRDLTRNMIIIQQARLRGIDTPNTYSDLETERAAWNTPTDDIVFGPRTLGPAEFNSYRIHGIINGLKTVLLQNELRPTPAQLRAAFETLHEDLRTEPFIAQVVRFFWDEGLPNDEIQAVTRSLIEQGFSPEEIEANLSDLYQGFTIAEFEIDSRFGSRESPYEIERKNILWDDGAEGLIFAGPLEEPAIYLVTEFEGGGELRFEDGIHLGRNRWINDQFEVFIDEKIRQARITLFRDEDFTRPLN